MGPAGLFLSRQLFRAGYVIYGVGKEDDIGRYSNTLSHYYAAEDIDSIRVIVTNIIKDHQESSAYICSDQYLTMFIEEWPEIFSIISFKEPGYNLLSYIANKENLIASCNQIGVRFPCEYKLRDLKRNITFPVAIKPNIKRGYSPISKVTIINDEDELTLFLQKAEQKGLTAQELIIQQFIPGDNRYEYGYGGYFRNGKAIVDTVFFQLRQYPQGVSCLTSEVEEEKDIISIKALVNPFLVKTKYDGFLQFDIKKHADTGEFYVLDINPRPWGSISILGPKCNNKSIFDKNFNVEEIKSIWRFPFKEVVSISNKNNVSYKEIKRSFSQKRKLVIDLFDRKDIKPFLMQLPVAIMKVRKKMIRRF